MEKIKSSVLVLFNLRQLWDTPVEMLGRLSCCHSHNAKPHHVSPMVAYAPPRPRLFSLSLDSTIQYPYTITGCRFRLPSSSRVLPLLRYPRNFPH